VASSFKSSAVDVHSVKSGKTKMAQHKAIQEKKKKFKPSSHQESLEELKCVHCGGTKHIFAKYKYKTYKCKICSKEGHLAKVCKYDKNAVSNTNYLDLKSKDKDLQMIDMYNLSNTVNSEEPLMIKIRIEGQAIDIELDTGAGKSVIPEKIFKEKFSQCKLESTKIRLRLYNGNIVIPE